MEKPEDSNFQHLAFAQPPAPSITQRLRSATPAEMQTSMAWEGAGEGSMGEQHTYGDGYGAEMSP